MGYLHPPPGDAPVIVMKDVGGDVREYSAMTTAYIRSGREVRLHECRSACTLALAVPNVCVYPDSVLRFHKAYNPITKATNEDVSSAMLSAYPPAVRERLGVLTRQYKSLTGSELIRLGVRDCNTPASPKVLIARASVRPSAPENPFSNTFGGLMAGLNPTGIPAYSGYNNAPVQVQRVKVQVAEAVPPAGDAPHSDASSPDAATAAVVMPVPPPRPAQLDQAAAQNARDPAPSDTSSANPPAANPQDSSPPLPPQPPFRALAPAAPPPKTATRWGAPINGAAPTLASARFAPFPYRLTRKG
ncbi:hypothetical protein [Rhodoblastus sp.]|uniref:hypothetical protein n=1 Tax=Rhodoblastus sp. TaxID=1962975 RepID=UPI0035B1703D